jgi:hypothetical protein
MIEASGTFDAWGSALVGGVASAVAVLLAVFVTFSLTSRKAKEDERRQAAARLMVEISNVRDRASSHTTGPIGAFALYPLRNTIFTTYVPLHKYDSFKVVDQFYKTVEAWREWGRTQDPSSGSHDLRTRAGYVANRFPWVEEYLTKLDEYGGQVIGLLQDNLEDKGLSYSPPELPQLNDTPLPLAKATARKTTRRRQATTTASQE